MKTRLRNQILPLGLGAFLFLMGFTATIPLIFETHLPPRGNGTMDSAAIWVARNSQQGLLFISDKTLSYVEIHDPVTNTYLGRIGGAGTAPGRLLYPNGLGVAYDVPTAGGPQDILFVVERDNHRVSMFALPDAKFLGHFGSTELGEPYGIACHWHESQWQVWLTDKAGSDDQVFVYNLAPGDSGLVGQLAFWFSSKGSLESIVIDPVFRRVLLCDEKANDVMVYDFNGNLIRRFGEGRFVNDPEGVVIYDLGQGAGYIVVTDQNAKPVEFEVFDRQTCDWLGNFSGVTHGTDGIALTQLALPNLPAGSFYAVHSDNVVHAYHWADIAQAAGLRTNVFAGPELAPIDDQEMDAGTARHIAVSAADPNGDAITLSARNLPAFASFADQGNGTGIVSFAPGFEQSGLFPNIQVTATDHGSPAFSDTISFQLIVKAGNRKPKLAPLSDQIINEGSRLEVAVSATDPNGDWLTLAADNLPAFGSFTDNGDGTGLISLAPDFEAAGVYSGIQVIASDDRTPSLSDTVLLHLAINNVNRAPTIDRINNQAMKEGTSLAVAVAASDSDGDRLALRVSNLPPFGRFTDHGDGTGVINFAPDYKAAGSYPKIQVVAADEGTPPLQATRQFMLTVNNLMLVPVAPSHLRATAGGNSTINLSWNDDSNNENGFKIQRRLGNEAFREIGAAGANIDSYVDAGLAPGTTYRYRVVAFNAHGKSVYSHEDSATTTEVHIADPASNLALDRPATASSASPKYPPAKAVDDSVESFWQSRATAKALIAWLSVDLQNVELVGRVLVHCWNDSYPKSYELQVSNNNVDWKIVNSATAGRRGIQEFVFPPGPARYVRLYAKVPQCPFYRVNSFEIYSGPLPSSPPAPSRLAANAKSAAVIRLNWSDNAGDEKGYQLERKTLNTAFREIATIGANVAAYCDSGLAGNTAYVYRLRAYNRHGVSEYSAEATATTPTDPNLNLAQNRPATASGADSNYPAANAVDDSASTYWQSLPIQNMPAAWLSVDLQNIHLIGRVLIEWPGDFCATSFQLQASFDNASWTTILTATGLANRQELRFPATPARYVRVYMTDNCNVTYKISELKIYSSPSAVAKMAAAPETITTLPHEANLWQNYPNPFNPVTTIPYAVPEAMHVTLKICSLTGQQVTTLVNRHHAAGAYEVVFEASALPSGVYFSVLQAGGQTQTRRMILVK